MQYPRAARRRARTAEVILDVATTLVADHGLEALTIGKLAEAMDYTPGALYRYFKSKDAILAALHTRYMSQLHAVIDEGQASLAGRTDLPADVLSATRLVVLANTWIEHATANPQPMALIASSLADPRQLLPVEQAGDAIAAYLGLLARMAEIFEAAEQAGAATPGVASDRAIALGMGLQGVLQLHKVTRMAPGRFDPVVVANSLADALLSAWCVPHCLAAARAALES
jgi:AcrR family transcriptional regulator